MIFHKQKMAFLCLPEVFSLLHSFVPQRQEVSFHEQQIRLLQLFRMYYHLEECSLHHLLPLIGSNGQPIITRKHLLQNERIFTIYICFSLILINSSSHSPLPETDIEDLLPFLELHKTLFELS